VAAQKAPGKTKMVNREKRDLARALIQKFLSCDITNDEFDNSYPTGDKNDPAIGVIHDRLWGFWDDRHAHKLVGKYGLDPEARALFERCIAFLGSDLEYEWPPLEWRSVSQAFLRMIGLRRVADARGNEWTEKARKNGKWEVWPFMREEDYVKSSADSVQR
jgi:hypothetical protein